MNILFSTIARAAPTTVECTIHQVVRRFQRKKAGKTYGMIEKTEVSFFRFRKWFSIISKGINATKSNKGKPRSGQERLNSNPLRTERRNR